MPTIARSPAPAVMPAIGMSQSGVIVAALLAGFLVFVMIKGRLAVYYNLLLGGAGAAPSTPTPGTRSVSPSESVGPGLFGGVIPQSSPQSGVPGTAPAIGGGSTPIIPSISPFNIPGM